MNTVHCPSKPMADPDTSGVHRKKHASLRTKRVFMLSVQSTTTSNPRKFSNTFAGVSLVSVQITLTPGLSAKALSTAEEALLLPTRASV
jgi:hypothetical protein